MDLKAIVIHHLDKKSGGNPILVKAPAVLPITQLHIDFVDSLKDVYYHKSNPVYGVFDEKVDSYPFQKYLSAYLDHKTSFYDFSVKAVEHFETIIKKNHMATGGYVLFCHYTTTEDYVMTVVLNNKSSYAIGNNLDLTKDLILDLEKLDFANATNCSRWSNMDDTYLSFTKGRKNISNYFREFIGCTDYTSAKDTSENLKRAINDFLLQKEFPKTQNEKTKSEVYAYCSDRMRKQEDIDLNVVSTLIYKDDPEAFRTFAIGEEYQVSATFKGHNTLKTLKYLRYHSSDLSIEFDRKLLQTKRLIYDGKKNTLLINNVPQELQVELSNQNNG